MSADSAIVSHSGVGSASQLTLKWRETPLARSARPGSALDRKRRRHGPTSGPSFGEQRCKQPVSASLCTSARFSADQFAALVHGRSAPSSQPLNARCTYEKSTRLVQLGTPPPIMPRSSLSPRRPRRCSSSRCPWPKQFPQDISGRGVGDVSLSLARAATNLYQPARLLSFPPDAFHR